MIASLISCIVADFGTNPLAPAFKAPSIDAVKAAHAAGLANGGIDEGGPGPRPEDSKDFYGAYLRDEAGNKICIFAKGPF